MYKLQQHSRHRSFRDLGIKLLKTTKKYHNGEVIIDSLWLFILVLLIRPAQLTDPNDGISEFILRDVNQSAKLNC